MLSRLTCLHGECVVPRTDVDMEDWSVIGGWLDRVTAYLTTTQITPAMDYIRHENICDDTYSRKAPFMARLKVYFLFFLNYNNLNYNHCCMWCLCHIDQIHNFYIHGVG